MQQRVLSVVAPDAQEIIVEDVTVLMPIESTIATIDVDGRGHTVDRSCFIVAPSGARLRATASSAVASVAVLTFSPEARTRMVATHREVGVDPLLVETWFAAAALLPRTVWIHELVHRYLFERRVIEAHESEASRFLETEILKEVYFLFRDRDEGAGRASIQHGHGRAVARVLEYMHAHLTDWRSIEALAKLAGTSQRSLTRAFRKELGTTPAAYWRDRKLDAALDLLRGGVYSVAEVAERIGYDNPSAFGDAFRRRFGRSPSAFKPHGPVRGAP